MASFSDKLLNFDGYTDIISMAYFIIYVYIHYYSTFSEAFTKVFMSTFRHCYQF